MYYTSNIQNISHYKTKTCATKSRGGRKFVGDTGEDIEICGLVLYKTYSYN